jgi:outer membrane protein assembly factor BamD (BamD/ComL family)
MNYALALALALVFAVPAAAQRAPISSPVDPDAERVAAHNLDVGRQYFKKKAWAGAKDRLEEILAEYPEFTRIDEVYYLLGVCYTKAGDAKLARESFRKLVDERPDSDYAKRAREELGKLGEP